MPSSVLKPSVQVSPQELLVAFLHVSLFIYSLNKALNSSVTSN